MVPDSGPGKAWYAAAAALAIAGCVAGAALFFGGLTQLSGQRAFAVPGTDAFEVEKPGRYALWHDHATQFEGEAISVAPRLPDGVRIRVLGPGGEVEARRARTNTTSKIGSTERVLVDVFDAPVAGRYDIEVQGSFPRRILSVGPDNLLRAIALMFGGIATLLLACMGATVLAVWVYFRREAAAERAQPGSSDMTGETATQGPESEYSLKQLTQLVYALQAASFLVGFSGIAGVIVNYVKREDVAGTLYESHFNWQIRTFWWSLGWAVLGLLLLIVVVGFVILAADAIWLLYRIIKGWLRLSEGKPMPG